MRTVGRKCVQFAAHIRCAKVLCNGHVTAELLLTVTGFAQSSKVFESLEVSK